MAAKNIKSIDKGEYAIAWTLLRSLRMQAKLSQQELGEALGRTQTFVSDAEIGRRRLDILQIYEWCKACKTTLSAYAQMLEGTLDVLPSNLPKVVREKRPRLRVPAKKATIAKKRAPRKSAKPK
jgi:transcriptional regulator with XRE-family HTH domain